MTQKELLIGPFTAGLRLTRDLGNGLTTQGGDRMSRYIPIAKGKGDKADRKVHVCLIEEKAGIPECSWGYGIHVVDDVDGADCTWFQTDSLKFGDLVEQLHDLLQVIEKGLPLP